MYLETLIIDEAMVMPDGSKTSLEAVAPLPGSVPLMQFFPGATRNSDPTNYWGPNIRCVEAMLAETQFSVLRVVPLVQRGVFHCSIMSQPETARCLRSSMGIESP